MTAIASSSLSPNVICCLCDVQYKPYTRLGDTDDCAVESNDLWWMSVRTTFI
jgi:hypothetical protein